MLRYRPRLVHLHTYLMLRYRTRLLHLHTYLMLRYRPRLLHLHNLAHIPDATLQMGLCGVGWGGLRTFNGTSTHTWCYATGLFSCTCTHTWCYATDLVSCTCTHTWCYATDLVSCTCTHTWCYATDLVSCTCTPDATLQMGWGGVGWANNVQWHTYVMLRYRPLLLHLHT